MKAGPRVKNIVLGARGNYATQDNLLIRKKYLSLATPRRPTSQALTDKIKSLGARSVLDVGCGTGDFLIELRKSGFKGEAYGVDISKGMLATGIAQNRKEKLGIKFIVGNAERLPFESGRFDVVVAKHMLYHLQHPQKGINEMRRCLADHGTMIITLNSKGNTPLLHECSLMICRKYGLTSMHGYGYISTESVKRYLKGFKVAKPIITKSRIDRPDMFPAYFASFRDFYRPYPNDRKWAMMIDDVRKFVDKRLAKEGKFIETRTMGIIYAVKKGG